MFGEYSDLDSDLDICGINRNGGFDDPSDDTNYSFDAETDTTASISDDYLDTFDSEPEQKEPQPEQNVAKEVTVEEQEPQLEQTNIDTYQPQKGSSSIYLIVLILLLLTAAGLFYYKKNVEQPSVPTSNQELGDYFYDKAVENEPAKAEEQSAETAAPAETMATVDVDLAQVQQPVAATPQNTVAQEQKNETTPKFSLKNEKAVQQKPKTSVVIPVTSGGRLDPFVPFNERPKITSKQPKFDIVAPPMEIPMSDPMIDTLMEVKITGIMYDNIRPSAIIVIDGNEQLVHKGDIISDYKILNITKDKVVMKYKTNVYEVSAGQTFASNGVNMNPVSSSSLSKQFGGAYTKQQNNVINFN